MPFAFPCRTSRARNGFVFQLSAGNLGKIPPRVPGVKNRSIKEQRLDARKNDFRPLLLACLGECADGRYGLFG